jgi:hypothetical protein
MNDTTVGVDLAKRVFQAQGASMTGRVKFRDLILMNYRIAGKVPSRCA